MSISDLDSYDALCECDDFDSCEFPGQRWFDDSDGDLYYEEGTSLTDSCLMPAGLLNASFPNLGSSICDFDINPLGGNECNDSNSLIHPGAVEFCDGLDNNCVLGVDEDTAKCLSGSSFCSGVVDCSVLGVNNCGSVSACSLNSVFGLCNGSVVDSDFGASCLYDSQCSSKDCITTLNGLPHGEFCVGTPSCSMFTDNVSCDGVSACSWDFAGESATNEAACSLLGGHSFVCQPEICSNGLDDDGDGLVDCQDDDCYEYPNDVGVSDPSFFNCLGSLVTEDMDLSLLGLSYSCTSKDSDGDVIDPTVGLCCHEGWHLEKDDALGIWSCTDTDACLDLLNQNFCNAYYLSDFSSWLSDGVDCVNPVLGLACCPVVQFGDFDYYSNSGNVVVY